MTPFTKTACPFCGWNDFPKVPSYTDNSLFPKELLRIFNIDSILDGDGKEYLFWTEHWQCPKCSKKFSFRNANY